MNRSLRSKHTRTVRAGRIPVRSGSRQDFRLCFLQLAEALDELRYREAGHE